MQIRADGLPETVVHDVLSNSRRTTALRELRTSGGRIGVRELSEAIAADETGKSPAPRAVRESVYASLHQTHLPRLDELGVVKYDRVRKEVRTCHGARDVNRYMDVVTGYGVTWGELYRGVGVAGSLAMLGSLLSAPVLGALDPLLWTSGTLGTFAALTLVQLWRDRRPPSVVLLR